MERALANKNDHCINGMFVFAILMHALNRISKSARESRLRAVSLFLENPWERTQNKKTCKRDCERDLRAAMPRAASSVGVGRRVKRETALVSYNDLDARHSGDGVILLVGLRSYDAHLSVTFLSDMQRTPKLCYNVCLLRCDSNGS